MVRLRKTTMRQTIKQKCAKHQNKNSPNHKTADILIGHDGFTTQKMIKCV